MLEPIRYAEFCTGVGGFRLGIEASGIKAEPVYTNEIDENCEKTYRQNFGIGFDSKDIFEINPSTLPDFDMLCAGFHASHSLLQEKSSDLRIREEQSFSG